MMFTHSIGIIKFGNHLLGYDTSTLPGLAWVFFLALGFLCELMLVFHIYTYMVFIYNVYKLKIDSVSS
jgi:hypothetical protein